MEATCSSETSIDFQRTTRLYIQEDGILITTSMRASSHTKLPNMFGSLQEILISVKHVTRGILLGLMFKHKIYFQIPFQENSEVQYYEIRHG
jgi:hypothetical protein